MPTFCRLPDSFAADLLAFQQATERCQAGEPFVLTEREGRKCGASANRAKEAPR